MMATVTRRTEAGVRLYERNWMQIDDYLEHDDRVVIPLGSVEQHAYLSLGTDAILAEKCAVAAAEGTGVPVLPVMPFGLTPRFVDFPGTVSLSRRVFLDVVRDILDALHHSGFRRFLLVSGHYGNAPARELAAEWEALHPGTRVVYHPTLMDPPAWERATSLDPDVGHGSWVENHPETRLSGVAPPDDPKPAVDSGALAAAGASDMRELLGDGSFGGAYELADPAADEVWALTVASVRRALTDGWDRDD